MARKSKKHRKKAWVTEDLKGQMDATAMIMQIAQETGQSLEETAASLERLEEDGFLERLPDGSVLLLASEKRS